MALSPSYKAKIVAALPPKYREAYEAGEIDDALLQRFADRAGILPPKEMAPPSAAADKPQPAPAPKQEKRGAIDQLVTSQTTVAPAALGGVLRSLGAAGVAASDDPFWSTGPAGFVTRKLRDLVAPEAAERERAAAEQARQLGQRITSATEQRVQGIESRPLREATEAVTDVAGSPSSLGSVPGGAFGLIPLVDAYNQQFAEARAGGLSVEDARDRARIMAAPELISLIPTAGRIPGLRQATAAPLRTTAERIVRGTAGTAVKEGLSETATTGLQELANTGLATYGNEAQRAFAKAKASLDVYNDMWRSFKAGMVGGGALGSASSSMEAVAENGRRAAEMTKGHAAAGGKLREEARKREAEKEQARIKEQQVETAYAERQSELDAQRIEDEREAAFRTMEARRKAEDILAKNPGNIMAERLRNYTVTPEMVASERTKREEAERVSKQEQESLAREAQLVPYRQQAEKDLKKSIDEEYKKAQSKHQAARRKASAAYVAEARQLPQDQRADYLAGKLLEWDQTNPKPSREAISAGPSVSASPPVTEAVAPQTTEVPAPTSEQTTQPTMSEQDIRSFGLSSSSQNITGTTSEQVITQLGKEVGKSREAAALSKLIADGKLVLVDDASQIPGYTPEMKGTAGYYDGQRMYVSANTIDPQNIKGSMLVVAAHEAKHAADFSGTGRVGVASIGGFIGTEANARINNKITEAASRGEPAAEFAMSKVEGMSAEDAALELPAYYVTAAVSGRGNKTILSDIVSAVRTRYKAVFGKDDINLKDVGYMASRLVQNMAVSTDSITGDINNPLAMVVGSDHPDFAGRKARGLTYVDYDGKEKTLLSDSEASLNPEGVESLFKNGVAKVGNVISIPSLDKYFNGALKDVYVVVNTELEAFAAQAVPTPLGMEIQVSTSFADTSVADPSYFKGILLHEMQHVVQQIEDFARGGSPSEFYTEQDKEVFIKQKEAGRNVLNFINNVFAEGGSVESWPIDYYDILAIKAAIKDYNDRLVTSVEAAETIYGIATSASAQKTRETLELLTAATDFLRWAKVNSSLNKKAREAKDRAYEKYENLLGEREARFTQEEYKLKQQELDALTRPTYYGEIIISDPASPDRYTYVQGSPRKGLASKSSGMMEDLLEEARIMATGNKARYLARNVVGQFTGFGVLGRELGNAKELAEGEAAAIAYVAEGDYYRTKFGIEKMARRKRIPLSKAMEEVDIVLKEAAKIEDVARREAYIGRYVTANPEMRPLASALDNIAKQSKAIVAARARDPRPMTEEEIAKYTAIIKNRYAYFTTTYAAFQGREGEIRNARLKRQAALANKREASGREVPAKYKASQKVYNRAVEFVANNDVAVFDPEMLARQPLDRIEYLYSLWVGDPNALRGQILNDKSIKGDAARKKTFRVAAEAAIAEAGKGVDQEAVRREAQYVVDGMLGLNEQSNPVITYYRGAKEDRSILEAKTRLPEQIAELYGEVTDIPTRVAITLAKQGELAARMRMLNTIYMTGKGKWFIDRAEYKNSPEYDKFSEELNGEEWGPLNGTRVTPEIAAGLNDGLDIFTPLSNALAQGHASVRAAEASSSIAMRGLRRMSSIQKFVQIVLSPFNTAVNFLGSGTVIAQNGGARPEDMLRALRASLTLLNNQIAPQGVQDKVLPMTTNPDLELFLKYTLLDSAVGQELRSMPTKFLKQLIVEAETASSFAQAKQRINKLFQTSGNAKNFITEAFALSDAWVKPAVFLSRLRFLERVNKAENKGWSKEQMEQLAADMTKDTTITFQRAAPVVKLAERLPLTWYATYMQGVFRSVMYSYQQAAKDFIESTKASTPEGQLLYAIEGAKRLSGAMAATAGAAFATKAISSVFNDDEDEEYIDGAKKLLFAEGRYGDGLYLGKNASSDPVFMRLSRLDPNGPVNDMLRILMSDDDIETKQQAIVHHIKGLWIMPRTTADVSKFVVSIFSDDPVKNRSTKLERLLPKTTSMFKEIAPMDFDTAESFIQILDGFVPGAANAFDQESGTPKTDQDLARAAIGWALLLTGGRFDVADPHRAAFGAGDKLDKLQKQGRSKVSEALELFGPQAAVSRFVDLREEELEAYSKLKDVYDGLLQMGYSPGEATKILKDNKVQAQDIAVIRQGRTPTDFTSLIDEDSLNKLGTFRDRDLSPEEKKQKEKARKDAIRKLQLLLRQKDSK